VGGGGGGGGGGEGGGGGGGGGAGELLGVVWRCEKQPLIYNTHSFFKTICSWARPVPFSLCGE